MSYCRWSSNNWDCDLYCYPDVRGGYTTHVAGMRRKGVIPALPDMIKVSAEEFVKAWNLQMEALEKCELIPIGLAYDGQTFNDPDLKSFLDRVQGLKDMGYHVRQEVIEQIKEEGKDE